MAKWGKKIAAFSLTLAKTSIFNGDLDKGQ